MLYPLRPTLVESPLSFPPPSNTGVGTFSKLPQVALNIDRSLGQTDEDPAQVFHTLRDALHSLFLWIFAKYHYIGRTRVPNILLMINADLVILSLCTKGKFLY